MASKEQKDEDGLDITVEVKADTKTEREEDDETLDAEMLAGLISSEEEVSEEEISEINKMIKTYDPQPNAEEEGEKFEEVKEL